MSANDEQVGGTHYKTSNGVQHWDWACNLPYLEGITTGYIGRHAEKDGFKDLLKAFHCLEKMMEVYYPFEWSNHKLKQKERLPQPIEIRSEHIPDVEALNKANQEFYPQHSPEVGEECKNPPSYEVVPAAFLICRCGYVATTVEAAQHHESKCSGKDNSNPNPPRFVSTGPGEHPGWVCKVCNVVENYRDIGKHVCERENDPRVKSR